MVVRESCIILSYILNLVDYPIGWLTTMSCYVKNKRFCFLVDDDDDTTLLVSLLVIPGVEVALLLLLDAFLLRLTLGFILRPGIDVVGADNDVATAAAGVEEGKSVEDIALV